MLRTDRTLKPARRLNESGMTLIEVLVATAITAIILTTCYGIYSRVLTQQVRLDARSLLWHQARVLSHRLALELRSLASTPGASSLALEADAFGRPRLEIITRSAAEEISGLVLVRYEMRMSDEGELSLARGEKAAYLQDTEIEPRSMLNHVRDLKLEVFDGAAWQERWSAGQPRSLRLTLSMAKDAETVEFSTVFDLGGS